MEDQVSYGPVGFGAAIHAVGSPRLIEGWIVGTALSANEDSEKLQMFSFRGDELKLKSLLEEAASLRPIRDPQRWIAEHGSFRAKDWTTEEEARKLSLPDEVRKHIQDLHLPQGWKFYLLSEADLEFELRRLRGMTLLARHRDDLPALRGAIRELYSLIHKDYKDSPPIPMGKRALLRYAGGLMYSAFNWVLLPPTHSGDGGIREGSIRLTFLPNMHGQPAIDLQVGSVLELLYCCLVANFTKQWKECKRPACRRLFIQSTERKRDFCTRRCQHAEFMKTDRAEKKGQKRSKGKNQKRSKGRR